MADSFSGKGQSKVASLLVPIMPWQPLVAGDILRERKSKEEEENVNDNTKFGIKKANGK